jgi:hypothetical protein
MDRRLKWLFGLLVTAVLVTDVVGYLPFLSMRQVRVNSPVEGFTYARSFLAQVHHGFSARIANCREFGGFEGTDRMKRLETRGFDDFHKRRDPL